jgi:hypothetical protein
MEHWTFRQEVRSSNPKTASKEVGKKILIEVTITAKPIHQRGGRGLKR